MLDFDEYGLRRGDRIHGNIYKLGPDVIVSVNWDTTTAIAIQWQDSVDNLPT